MISQFEKQALDDALSIEQSAPIQSKLLAVISNAEEAAPLVASAMLSNLKKNAPGGAMGLIMNAAENELVAAFTSFVKKQSPESIVAYVNKLAAEEVHALGG